MCYETETDSPIINSLWLKNKPQKCGKIEPFVTYLGYDDSEEWF